MLKTKAMVLAVAVSLLIAGCDDNEQRGLTTSTTISTQAEQNVTRSSGETTLDGSTTAGTTALTTTGSSGATDTTTPVESTQDTSGNDNDND